MWRSLSLVCAFSFTVISANGQAVRRDELKPGLLFTITDKQPAYTHTRLEPAVAITLNPGEAAHPQSSGGDVLTWDGYIQIVTAGKYTFDAMLLGDLNVTIDGKPVLTGKVAGKDAKLTVGQEVDLSTGIQRFTATLNRTDPGMRVLLHWTGPGFRREPIPNFFYGHTVKIRPATFGLEIQREHGRFLFEEMSCIKCHQPTGGESFARSLAPRSGPNLSEIGKRAYAGWLDAWLEDPKKLRPQTTMPHMFDSTEKGKAERYAVVSYLTSLGGPLPEFKPPLVSDNNSRQSIDRGSKLYLTAGCAACHGQNLTQAPKKKMKDDEDDREPPKPEDSYYGLGSPSGAQSYYLLGAIGSKTRPDTLSKYLEDPLKTNPHGRMPKMVLTSTEATDIARHMCRVTDNKISSAMPAEPSVKPSTLVDEKTAATISKLKPADQWKAVGQSLVVSKGCVNCHDIAPGGKALAKNEKFPSIEAIRKNPDAGCVAEKPKVGVAPDYKLTPLQRDALTEFIPKGLVGRSSPSPVYYARTSLKRFNCLNCHNRTGEGGIDPDLAAKMKLNEKAENADDVNPPRLMQIGLKMRTSFMSDVLLKGERARPWMTLRMPQYGKANVGSLPECLPLLDGTIMDDTIAKVEFQKEVLEAGKTLAGKNGHGCISCHDISGQIGGGTRGPDLALTNRRVRYDWYVRWMHQPQRMVPGTKMPQAFIEGQALLKTVYNGDGDKQLNALWAYFSLGPGLPLPIGLEPPKGMVVIAKERPEILRTFMPEGAGTKGVAVGFPSGMNYVFDTQRCEVAYAWSGNFLDATNAWNARGGKPAGLLGPKFWAAPGAHPWAMTDSREPPDLSKRSSDPAYGANPAEGKTYQGHYAVQSEGYSLDTNGVPTFTYSLTPSKGGPKLRISESPTPLTSALANGLQRKFLLEQPGEKTLWFQAGASDGTIRGVDAELKPIKLDATDEMPTVGTKLLIPYGLDQLLVLAVSDAPAGSAWRIVKNGSKSTVFLRLPEAGKAGAAAFTLQQWSLAKDDATLLKGLK